MSAESDILENMKSDAERNGYFMCPDEELLDDLIAGLVTNEERYGYASCPCRIAVNIKTYDADIICPCEYRDADVDEFGMCYCALFVSEEIADDPTGMGPIPERRPVEIQEAGMPADKGIPAGTIKANGPETVIVSPDGKKREFHVWRCEVCGYLCAREFPPPICPICKVRADRFHLFGFG